MAKSSKMIKVEQTGSASRRHHSQRETLIGLGQTARSGVRIKRFEGGKMPLHRRLPKRGFKNTPFARKLNEVNLGRVQAAIDAGLLDAGATVDAAALVKARVLRRAKEGVRL